MLEDVPEGWRAVRLGEMLRERRHRVGERANDFKVVSITNTGGVRDADTTFSKQVYSKDQSAYKVLMPGWFGYNPSRINVGSIARHGGDFAASVSPMYVVFSADGGGADPNFVRHLVASDRFNERVGTSLQGSVRNSLSFDALAAFPFAEPPAPEQRAIAAVLDAADEVVAASEAEIGASLRHKRQVMRTLLTHGTAGEGADLVPLEARWVAGRVAEGIEAIPRGWSLVRLTSVARLESGHTPSRKHPEYWDGDVPWVSLNDTGRLNGMTIDETEETVAELGLKNSSARLLPKDTVLFSRTATVGKITRLGRPMATSQDFANWVCGDDLSPGYLAQLFRACGREWQRLQSGSTHQTIYMPDFKRLQILLPPLPEQHRIAEIGEAFDARVEAERAVLARARERKTALASELLSGRTRLPPAMIARYADPAKAAA